MNSHIQLATKEGMGTLETVLKTYKSGDLRLYAGAIKVLNNLAVNPSMTYNLVCDAIVGHALDAITVLHDEEKYLVVALSLISRLLVLDEEKKYKNQLLGKKTVDTSLFALKT